MAYGHANTTESHEKRERNARVGERYDQLNREGKLGHYGTVFCIVREEVERERERCAKIAEHLNGWGSSPCPELAHHIAHVIRAPVALSSAHGK